MKHSPSASQESSGVLYMSTIYCRVYKNPLATPILSQIKEVHNIPPYLFSIHFNIILISSPKSFLQIFRTKLCTYSPSLQWIPHSQPLSSFLSSQAKWNFTADAHRPVPHYAVFSGLLLQPPRQAHSTLFSTILTLYTSVYSLPSVSQT